MGLYIGGAFDTSYEENYETTTANINDWLVAVPAGVRLSNISILINGTSIEVSCYAKDLLGDHTNHTYFTLSEFVGNCGIVILSGLETCKGLVELACNIAKAMGYSQILYSVNNKQPLLTTHLTENGFKLFAESPTLNKRSDNTISIYFKNI